jgi:hypothetical protein
MDWVIFQSMGFKNRISGGVYTVFSIFTLVAATIQSVTIEVSLQEGIPE